jgi:hypothetical protein
MSVRIKKARIERFKTLMRKLKGWFIPGNERGNANGIFPIARIPKK